MDRGDTRAPMIAASRDGVRIAVHDLGGAGAPLVLAHPAGFHGLIWGRLASLLSERFHVWSFDFRAHGASEGPPDGELSAARLANDLLGVIDALTTEPVLVFGHSLGGAATVLAAAREPGAFAGLYVYEPAIAPRFETPFDDRNVMAIIRRRRARFADREVAMAYFRGRSPYAELSPETLLAYIQHGFEDGADGGVQLRCRPEDEATLCGWSHDEHALAAVRCPVTVGGGTTAWTGKVAEWTARALRTATFIRFDGLGHLGPLCDPDAVAASVITTFA